MSRALEILVICLYTALSFTLAQMDPTPNQSAVFHTVEGKALFAAIVDIVLLTGFAWAALWIRDLPARRPQTITALAGVGSVFQAVAWPINSMLLYLGEDAGLAGNLIVLLLVGLIIWNIVVFGHIMRHALEVSFPTGAGTALLYTILSIKVSIFIAAN